MTSISQQLRKLDALSPRWAVGLGLGLGLLVGVALLLPASGIWGGLGFLFFLGGAVALGFGGEPVVVWGKLESGLGKPVLEPVADGVIPAEEWVLVPGGDFLMGSPEDEEGRYEDEGPVHEVSISAFLCLRVPVTRKVYMEVVGKDPGSPGGLADTRPVNQVSWFDAVQFCNQLSKKEGLTPCYLIEGDEVHWQREVDGYRLLTEAEWEYACRAGSRERWAFGDDEQQLGEYAWFNRNSKNQPQPVGQKKPNDWGFFDMHGNVWEWCWDWFGSYSSEAEVDPGGASEGESRVLRGGSFFLVPGDLRSASRSGDAPGDRFEFIGFRCARGPRLELDA